MNSTHASNLRRPSAAAAGTFFAFALLLLPLATSVAAGATGDATNGKALFEKRCTGCHALDKDKEGPRLKDVYGRHAGSVATFKYSDELKGANVTWDDASLDKWLTDPDSVVPGNDMAFHVPKAEERADIIAYLRAAAGK